MGKVTEAYLHDNALADCEVTACLVDVFRKLEFPEPGEGVVTVYPIMFAPG